ncbi:IS5 family transposase [Streptomyces sp. NRRL S-920]|uniref:IS5 family transposase n=1 Tax=Streptomyces sp. NRRL S-920 TaxID=1463921 RepID=UPI000566536B|nr:IS5 family transposase [Streptomyces sp. NRRL S-920]
MRRRRYPSDTTDEEWSVIEPLLPPAACTTPRGGRPERHPRREIIDALRYVVSEGCRWRSLPADFPPPATVYGFFRRWTKSGALEKIRDHLRREVRCAMGASPHGVATVIDSQSVKAAEMVGKDSRGFDPGKRINGRKRHVVVDLHGLPLLVTVTPASTHDANAARLVLARLRAEHPEIAVVWADRAYAGTLVSWAKTTLGLTIKTVSRPKGAAGFVLLPRRWIVERSLAWILHARRLVRDYERLPAHAEAMVNLALITLMSRRLTRPALHPTAAALRPGAALQAA